MLKPLWPLLMGHIAGSTPVRLHPAPNATGTAVLAAMHFLNSMNSTAERRIDMHPADVFFRHNSIKRIATLRHCTTPSV